MDPVDVRLKNIIKEGETSPAYNKELISVALDRCIKKGKELIKWDEKYPYKEISPTKKERSVGMALAMARVTLGHIAGV